MSYQIRGAFWIWFSIRPVWQFKACLLQQTNYLLSHFTSLMDSNCSIKLPLVDIIWKIAYIQKPSQQDWFFWSERRWWKDSINPIPWLSHEKFRLMKHLQRSILRFKLPVATTIGTNYQGTKGFRHQPRYNLEPTWIHWMWCKLQEPTRPYFHIFWLIPPLEEFQMFSCS